MKHILLFFVLFFAVPVQGYAQQQNDMPWLKKETVKPLTPAAREQILNQVESYINRITTMQSGFVQIAPDGILTEGKFYLSRPGRIRWEYFPPASVIIVGKSGLLTYYDKGLDQISHSSIDSTPVTFLTRKHIDLQSKDLEVRDVKETSIAYEVTLAQKDKSVEGRVILTFLKSPMELKKIEVVDGAEQHTRITFTDSVFGQPIRDDLFIIQNPRIFKKR